MLHQEQEKFLRVNIWAKFYCLYSPVSTSNFLYSFSRVFKLLYFSISIYYCKYYFDNVIMEMKNESFFTNRIYFVSLLHNGMNTYLLLFLSNPVGNNFTCCQVISIIERNTSSMNVFLKRSILSE